MLIDYPNNTVQVITGSNESVKVFNTEAQNIYNSDGKSSEYKRISNKYCEKYQFRSGDPVIFLNNRYIDTEPKYLNGEGGTIVVNNPNVFVETFDKKCHNFNDVDVENDVGPFYASNTWKTQGSEFNIVLVILDGLVSKEAFYTAVTRAKRQVLIVCTQQNLEAALSKSSLTPRSTYLAECCQQIFDV